jgi:hypothetical protein
VQPSAQRSFLWKYIQEEKQNKILKGYYVGTWHKITAIRKLIITKLDI